jgi:isocitrate dehydrogenase
LQPTSLIFAIANVRMTADNKKRITIAYGDGIGPEIMDATLRILQAAEARLEYDVIEVGEKQYLSGNTSGISDEAWSILKTNKVLLKSPITTPQGGGYKSLNVTMRKMLGMFSNVRPSRSYAPYVRTHFPNIDMVIVRENEEDLYAGIEYQQTPEVVHTIKLITRSGSEKIIRYAFEYARANGRKKVTCMTKDNIMKHTDGMFHQLFNEVAAEYPEIAADHYIIDIGAARIADDPERFDVIVTLNLYGDIISDIAAEVSGSVGLCGSANIGDDFAMFEAIHGSAPDIAGKNIANPSGLINAACLMLQHLGQADVAAKIENALLKTLEDGIHTGEIYKEGLSVQKAGTREFADAIIARLGQKPQHFKAIENEQSKTLNITVRPTAPAEMTQVGVDVYVHADMANGPAELVEKLKSACEGILKLKIVTNRGLVVYPKALSESMLTDQSRCRFVKDMDYSPISQQQVVDLMVALNKAGLVINKTEGLYFMNGKRAFSLAQGE